MPSWVKASNGELLNLDQCVSLRPNVRLHTERRIFEAYTPVGVMYVVDYEENKEVLKQIIKDSK